MLYELLNFALRPFRRWWRRLLIAAVVGTVVMPAVRQQFDPTPPGEPQRVIELPR